MRVDANWLETLVAEVRKNPLIAAAAPKIRFWTKFQLLTIQGPAEFQLDERVLLSSLTYKKHFTVHGDASNGWIRSKPMSGNEAVVLHIPIQIEPITLQLHTEKIQDVFLIASGKGLPIHLSQGANVCEHRFSRAERLEGYYIINNAGSALDANLNPFDRGFGYVDSGDFDSADELDFFVGEPF